MFVHSSFWVHLYLFRYKKNWGEPQIFESTRKSQVQESWKIPFCITSISLDTAITAIIRHLENILLGHYRHRYRPNITILMCMHHIIIIITRSDRPTNGLWWVTHVDRDIMHLIIVITDLRMCVCVCVIIRVTEQCPHRGNMRWSQYNNNYLLINIMYCQ